MTEQRVKEYLELRLKQLNQIGGLSGSDVTKLADRAYDLGLIDIWNAGNWSFKAVQYNLDTSGGTESYVLPSNFSKLISALEKTTISGTKVLQVDWDTFHNNDVNVSSYSPGVPRICTVYTNNRDKYIKFAPIPQDSVIYLNYAKVSPTSVVDIDEVAISAALACMEKYLFPSNTVDYAAAYKNAYTEIQRLERNDSTYGGTFSNYIDPSQLAGTTNRVWI